MYYTDHFVIDWEKVQSIEDIKVLLKAMQVSFEPDHPGLKTNELMSLVKQEPKPGYGLTTSTTTVNPSQAQIDWIARNACIDISGDAS